MQTYSNRYANLSQGGEGICKSGLHKVLTMRLSVWRNGTPGSPNMSLHRAQVLLLYQRPTLPLLPAWAPRSLRGWGQSTLWPRCSTP